MNSTRVFNQKVDIVSIDEVLRSIKISLQKKEKNIYFALNINILIQLWKNKKFKVLHEKSAKHIFADGIPIIWFSKFTKRPLLTRVSGTDLTEKLLQDKTHSVFILGGKKETLKKAKKKYDSVCGYYSPPYNNTWLTTEENKIIKNINQSKASIVLVAVGPLKQEKWLIKTFKKTTAHVGIGVGSAIEILTGEKKRAPKVLKDTGFEWAWRILLEPKRLSKRYISDFISMTILIVSQITQTLSYDIINIMKIVQKIQKKIQHNLEKVISLLSLTIVYFIGIGLTTLVAKISFKTFLEKKHAFTSWKKYSYSKNNNKMY